MKEIYALMNFFFAINISTNKKEMMQTLQEALYANSLEHKLEMQIKTALDSKDEVEQQVQTNNDTDENDT